jgi:hypothetical protein
MPADEPSTPVGRLQLIGNEGATAIKQRPVESAAGCRFPKLASNLGVTQKVRDHVDIGVMAVGYFRGNHQSEHEVDSLSVCRVEIYRF